MKQSCEICRGSQLVRLPRHLPVQVAAFETTAVRKLEQAYKEFPCPECTPLVPQDKVRVVECHFQADSRYEGEQGYREHIVRRGIMEIAAKIEEGGFMRLQETPLVSHEFKRGRRISVGVVAPQVTENLDAAREEAEDKFARIVADLAAKGIQNWGSYYGHSEILKRDAYREIEDALRRAKELRPRVLR